MSIMAFSVDSIYWNRTLHLVFLKALPSQIIDHSNFPAQHDLALDDEVEYKSCRHQLRQILNGLWINRRKQHEYHALFEVRDDKRGSIFEGNALYTQSNETVTDPG